MSLPRPEHAAEVIHKSNLWCIGHVDLAIFGDIHHLEGLLGSTWQGDGRSKHDIFRWKTRTTAKGKRVALIGCLEKIWGEAGSHIIQTLHGHSRVKHVVYVAKAGSLSAKYHPNEWIATGGDCVNVANETIQWRNPLEEASAASTRIARGSIVTVPSTLCETHNWLQEWSSKAVWVDCEVSFIAEAAVELGIDFGFLHIVSDTLDEPHEENLSNEESDIIVTKRKGYTKK